MILTYARSTSIPRFATRAVAGYSAALLQFVIRSSAGVRFLAASFSVMGFWH